MKLGLSFVIALVAFDACFCFLPYHFIAHEALSQFFDVIADKRVESVSVKNAVSGEKCLRECRDGDKRICHFNFTLKHYQVMGG